MDMGAQKDSAGLLLYDLDATPQDLRQRHTGYEIKKERPESLSL